MTAAGEGLFGVRDPSAQSWIPVTFYEVPGAGLYMHFGVRATPRVG
jgi:hypothetical protein